MNSSRRVRNLLLRKRVDEAVRPHCSSTRGIIRVEQRRGGQQQSSFLLRRNCSGVAFSAFHTTTHATRTYGTVATPATDNSNTANTNKNKYHYDEQLYRWTEAVLRPRTTPLGSLNRAAWNELFVAMQAWLGPSSSSSLSTEQNSDNDNDDQLLLIPRHVDMADKLLVRLMWEHRATTTTTLTAQRHGRRNLQPQLQPHERLLHEWVGTLRRAWLRVARHHPTAPLPVRRARVWWEEEQRFDTVTTTATNESTDAAAAFVDLLEAELRLSASQAAVQGPHALSACQRAAEMLLAETTTQELVPALLNDDLVVRRFQECHKQAVRQTLQAFSESNNTDESLSVTASNLLEQMEQLAQLPGWEDLRFQDDELDRILDALFLETTATSRSGTNAKELSDFEKKALQQRILTRIQSAGADDLKTVEELVQYWQSNMRTSTTTDDDEAAASTANWKQLARSVADYYLRIQDPVKSTKWLQIQDAISINTAKAVQEAIQSVSGTTPAESSSSRASESTAAGKSSELGDLDHGATVVTENQQERIQQKMDLLNVWASKADSPAAPYRATEILESLESEDGIQLDSKPYATTVHLWLKHDSSESNRKAFEIAMRCPVFDASLLSLIFRGLIEDHRQGRSNQAMAVKMIDLWKEHFDEVPSEEIPSLAEAAFELIVGIEKGQDLLEFLLGKGQSVSHTACENAVRSFSRFSQPQKVVDLISLLEANCVLKKTALSFECYRLAVHRLLDIQGKPCMVQVKDMYLRALAAIREKHVIAGGSHVAALFLTILHPAQQRDEALVGELLVQTEDLLLKQPSAGVNGDEASPLSLEFFKKVVAQLDKHRMPSQVEQVFFRLKEHHRAGWTDLHPDADIYKAYVLLLQKVHGLNSVDKRKELLEELIGLYEASNREAEQYKPQYQLFDGIIGGLRLRNKTSGDPSGVVAPSEDGYERDTQAVLSLIEKMHSLQIAPKMLDRSYIFNIAMELVNGSRQRRETSFETVMDLKRKMDDLGVQANFMTFVQLARAAEAAPPGKGLAVMLESSHRSSKDGKGRLSAVQVVLSHAIENQARRCCLQHSRPGDSDRFWMLLRRRRSDELCQECLSTVVFAKDGGTTLHQSLSEWFRRAQGVDSQGIGQALLVL